MKTFNGFRYFLLVALIVILLGPSCGGRQEGETRAITDNRERSETSLYTVEGIEDYPIPTSVEVVDLLQRAGAPFILGISNSAENVDRYFTENSKALNLGVYGADLSYAGTYEMNQEIMKYLQVCKQLIDELNISTSFNQGFVQRVEVNLEDKDSLINIVSESFYDTYIYLTDNHRDDLALLVMTGSWIEGMYLTSQIAIGARNNTEITDIILQQADPLEKLLTLLDKHEDDSLIYSLYQDIKEIYDFIIAQQSPMSGQVLDLFTEKIDSLRTKIIS
jgi:hypothetical protein